MSEAWRQQDYRLKYHLGDRVLFTSKLHLLVHAFSLSDQLAQRASLTLPSRLDPGIDGCLLAGLPAEGFGRSVFRHDGHIAYVLAREPRYFADMTVSFQDYVRAQFSSKSRATMQRKVRKFTEFCQGELRWKAYTTASQLIEFHVHARAVSAESYQEKLFDSGLPGDEESVREMQRRADQDLVRAFLLFHGELAVSYLYLDVHDDTLLYSYLGYLPGYRNWSVGIILQWLAMEALMSEKRFRLFDFTEGEGEHKRLFATGQVECANVLFLRRSLFHWGLVWSHLACNHASRALGRLSERLGIKARLRQLLRHGFSASKQDRKPDERSPTDAAHVDS